MFKRRFKKRQFEFPKTKDVRSDGSDPLAVFLGGMTTVGLVFLAWYYLAIQPSITAERINGVDSRFIKLDVETVNDLASLESKSAKQLIQLMIDHNAEPLPADFEGQGQRHQDRINLAELIESKKLTDEQIEKVATSKLEAVSSIYSLVFLDGLDLKKFDLPDQDHAAELSDELARLIALVGYQSSAFNVIADRADSLDVNGVTRVLVDMTNELGDDHSTLAHLNAVVEYCFSHSKTSEAKQLVQSLETELQSGSPTIRGLLDELGDEVVLREQNYRKLFKDRWDNGDKTQEQLFNCSLALIKNTRAGMRILSNVDQVAHWFEHEDQYDRAIKIYQEMLSSANNYSNKPAAAMAKELANDGIVRNQLVGKPINWEMVDVLGKRFTNDDFKNQVVVVFFWSVFDEGSIDQLQALHQASAPWNLSGIRILATSVDPEPNKESLNLAKSLNRFQFIYGNKDKSKINPILKQCPSKRVPRLMLVQKNGVVADTSISVGQVKTEARHLANQKN